MCESRGWADSSLKLPVWILISQCDIDRLGVRVVISRKEIVGWTGTTFYATLSSLSSSPEYILCCICSLSLCLSLSLRFSSIGALWALWAHLVRSPQSNLLFCALFLQFRRTLYATARRSARVDLEHPGFGSSGLPLWTIDADPLLVDWVSYGDSWRRYLSHHLRTPASCGEDIRSVRMKWKHAH